MKSFCRLRLLAMMAFFVAVIVWVIYAASPFSPVVMPAPENIEEIWAIEDSRTESEEPLIMALQNNGVALGYDKYENTFYCTLGLENGDEWPEIHLTAPGAEGIELCFVDDYTYDWCAEAIRENYAYELMAYNDEEYSYAKIVFTGLPILAMNTGGGVEVPARNDVPIELTWSCDAYRGINAYARTHKRGASTLYYENPKVGFKVEFTRNSDGTRKTQMNMENLGMTDEFILIPCLNVMMMQDRLCWDLYGMLYSEDVPFGKREMCYSEVFVNQEYLGVFLAMIPFDYQAELQKESLRAVETDSIYRTIAANSMDDERLIYFDDDGIDYELYYTHESEGKEFLPLGRLISCISDSYKQTTDADAAFCSVMLTDVNIDSFLQYFLFLQACGLRDNLINNMYVWAHRTERGYEYRMIPWDLNVSWVNSIENYEDQKWILLPPFDRAIELDCGGRIRNRLGEIWRKMRASVFTTEQIDSLIGQYTNELQESGAFYRDALKWNKTVFYPDGYSICAYADIRFDMLDRRIEEMTSEKWKNHILEIETYETFDLGEPACISTGE